MALKELLRIESLWQKYAIMKQLAEQKKQLSPRKLPELKSPDRKEEQGCPQLLATSCWIRA